jgi:putative transposon-encoded protein
MQWEFKDISVAGTIIKGYVKPEIIVRHFSTSGAIFVPRELVGKRFRLVLIPIDDIEEVKI